MLEFLWRAVGEGTILEPFATIARPKKDPELGLGSEFVLGLRLGWGFGVRV
jgi:hypothetical protein